jgi:4'-phosphopantetheinyl transferase
VAWYVGLPAELDQADVALLGAEEMERLSRLDRSQDKARYAASHASARRLIGRLLGVAPARVVLGHRRCPACGGADHGPPVARVAAPGAPDADLPVSMSRSGPHGLVALSRSGPVGADLEAVDTTLPIDEVAGRFFAAPEMSFLAGLAPADRAPAFFRAWCRKEAVAKAWGTGLVEDLRQVGVRPEQPGPVEVARPAGGGRPWVVFDLDLPNGVPGAVCFAAVGAVTRDA